MQRKTRLKTLLTIFFMGVAYALIFATPFIQTILYDPMITALKCSNADLGVLIMIFGLGDVVAGPLGGWISDKLNAKSMYLLAMVATSLLCFLFALHMTYTTALFIWGGFAIAGDLAYFPAHTKLVRFLGDENSQGKLYGLTESACGIGSVIIGGSALAIFARFASQTIGLKAVIISLGVICLLCAVVLYFLLENPSKEQREVEERFRFRDFVDVLKFPGTWLAGLCIFCTYTLNVSVSYFTPYLSDVLGMTVISTGVIAIIRLYLLRFVGAPLGGVLGDKLKSVSSVVGISLFGAAIIIVIFILAPTSTSAAVIIGLTLFMSLFLYMARGTMFAVPAEVRSPKRFAATTAGIVCAIGYCPDLFQYTLSGHWLDQHGNDGYRYIFIYTLCIMVLGMAVAVITHFYRKHRVAMLEAGDDKSFSALTK